MREQSRYPTLRHGHTLREHALNNVLSIEQDRIVTPDPSLEQYGSINVTHFRHGRQAECEAEFYSVSPVNSNHNILYVWNNAYVFLLAKKALADTWIFGAKAVSDNNGGSIDERLRNIYIRDIAVLLDEPPQQMSH